MIASEVLSQFSLNRLSGEPLPNDLKILLTHWDELAERTGIRLEWVEDWTPRRDSNDQSATDRLDPDVVANRRATEEVCRFIAFIGADADGHTFGYWRGPNHRNVAESPIVIWDHEGQFHLCIASNFAEAILARAYGREGFAKLRAWFRSMGIRIDWENPDQLTHPFEKSPPKDVYKELFDRYRRELIERP
jgi:hypothetical protein